MNMLFKSSSETDLDDPYSSNLEKARLSRGGYLG